MADAQPRLPLRRKVAYAAAFSLVVALLLLLGSEGVLRLAGYGYSPRFVRRVDLPDGSRILRENRWCTAPFFSPELVRRPQPMRLPATKPGRTFRIVVLGSSAAMGDPDASFSLARVLQKLLDEAYPDINVEVVNAGITAVNSHIVRHIAIDAAAIEPDLFIVYEGNNEVIGPFGPAGVFTPFLRTGAGVRTAVALKGTRVGQLVAAAARAAAGRGDRPPEDWGGMEMFMEQRIAADDPRLATVRSHFGSNLVAIAGAAADAGAACIVCTVPVNTRTFAPFASLHRAGLDAPLAAEWEDHVAAAHAAARAGDAASAEAAYRRALAIDDQYAETHYRLGQLALRDGRDGAARDHLRRALDLDALRFRTDTELNEVIRSLAGTSSVRIVDTAAMLDAASPHGLCGDEFLYEHVHLTLRGTYEFALALLPAVADELARRGLAPRGDAPPALSYDDLRLRLGFTAYEQGMIALEMLSRLERPPFTAQIDHATRIDLWRRRASAAQALLERTEALASLRAAMEAAMRLDPDDWVLSRNTGMMLVARGAPADAVPLLERAYGWIDDDADTVATLALACRALGRTSDAEAWFARLRTIEPRHPALNDRG